jgi:hypothetical protein
MNSAGRGTQFLQELKEFLAFLQSLWGLLVGITALFPLSNVFANLIPLGTIHDPQGSLGFLSPALLTATATLVTLFVILSTFGRRSDVEAPEQRGRIRRQARRSFAMGVFALAVYLAIYFGIYPLWYEPHNVFEGDPRLLIGDFALLMSYGTFFALATRAFMLLAMLEYFAKS